MVLLTVWFLLSVAIAAFFVILVWLVDFVAEHRLGLLYLAAAIICLAVIVIAVT